MPEERIAALEKKVDEILDNVSKMRRYAQWSLTITIVVIVLPILGLAFAIPSFISTYNETMQSLDLEGL